MTRKATIGFVALAAIILPATLAIGAVNSVQTNLFTGVIDTDFNGVTKELTVSESSILDLVVVNEGSIPFSGFTNMTFGLNTTFDSVTNVGGTTWAKFLGGAVSVTFEDTTNPLNVLSYELGGPIDVLLVKIEATSPASGGNPAYAQLSAEGLFQADNVNLPENPNGNWPALQSSLTGLIFEIGQDLTDFNWATDDWTDQNFAESQWQFLPDDSAVPEPATLALLMLGGLAVLRRR